MSSKSHVKEIVERHFINILQPSDLVDISKSNANTLSDTNQEPQNVSAAQRNLSKSIKLFVEHHIINNIDDNLKSIAANTSKETWKIDAHNVSKMLITEQKLSEVQASLCNILDSCVKEVKDPALRYCNETELEYSPLLQPEHIAEVIECMSIENPLDVRLNALQYLLKSHFTDAINGDGWFLLQKKLVDNLCDNNLDIFLCCMNIHVKLASCSSSIAIKECSLNLIESLGQHYFLYHNDSKTISFQNISFYRMVYLTRLLLDTFSEATFNVARFGDNRLGEMIDNFVQLLTIHVPSKPTKNKSLLTPLEIVSYLDPNGTWLFNLTHFFLSRQLFLSSIRKNHNFLRIITEEIMNWIGEPVIPSRNTSKMSQGELNFSVQKFSMFCHSFSVLSRICSFNVGLGVFPLKIMKKEDLLTINDMLKMMIVLLKESRFNEVLKTKSTETFRTFIAKNLAKMLSLKGVNGSSLLLMLFKKHEDGEQLISRVSIEIVENLSSSKNMSNLFIQTNMPLKRKFPLLLHNSSSVSNSNNVVHQLSGSVKKKEIELQSATHTFLELENKECSPLDVFLKFVTEKLKSSDLRDITCLVKISTCILKGSDKILGFSYCSRQNTAYIIRDECMKLQQKFSDYEQKFNNSDLLLSSIFVYNQFLLNTAFTSLGFHILQEINVIASLLVDGLQRPIVDWSDPVWALFVFKSTTTSEGCAILAEERDVIFKKELTKLWDTIDEDCSGSEIPIEDGLKQMLNIIANLTFTLRSVKALCAGSKHGSEETLTEETDTRPSNLYGLIQCFALNSDNCPYFIHHHFALNVLRIMISNMDSSLHLQNKFKYLDVILQIQSANCVDDGSEVIIDECSLLRQQIIEQSYFLSGLRVDKKLIHMTSQPESIQGQTKPRSRGTGELARWLSETRLGLHDNNWLKHARKLYKNSCSDDTKGSTIFDLLEQVVKVFPEIRTTIKWEQVTCEVTLLPEEQLAVQFVMKYGAHHRLIQSTQQNVDNLTNLIILVKNSLGKNSDNFEGFDWFVASVYLLCSGNVEKTQSFLSLISGLPSAFLIWSQLAETFYLAQMGSILETIIAEEMPIAFQVLQNAGLSWWQLCQRWIAQCWLNILDWPQICHWFIISILHQPDYPLYFCAALLSSNQDRLIALSQEQAIYEITINPTHNFQLSEARTFIEKLHKKYHNILQPYFV